jgi:hypothetical protein
MSPRRVLATLSCVAVALGMGGFVGTASAATPPSNDLISGATVVSSLPFSATLDTTGATTDAVDAQANQACGAPATNNSVWYSFTAGPGDTLLAVDTTGSTFSSGVLIATGTPGALTTQSCGPITSKVAVASGTTYYVMVFADFGPGGTLHLSMHGSGPVPANDTSGHPTVVTKLPFTRTLDTTGATTDRVDSQANASCGAPATGSSVWYKFTAGRNDRNIFVDASRSDYEAGVIIATGKPGKLKTLACGPGFVTTATRPGTTYYIMLFDAFGSGGGTLRLNIGDAPNLAVNVRTDAGIDTNGVVHLSGTYRCTGAKNLHILGSLVEIVGSKVPIGNFEMPGTPPPTCNGVTHVWTGLVRPPHKHAFAPGKAAALTTAALCAAVACTQVNVKTVVQLANGVDATSALGHVVSRRTRTFARASTVRFGNAVHTATWSH